MSPRITVVAVHQMRIACHQPSLQYTSKLVFAGHWEPAKHEIFLFSSKLQHAVQPNQSKEVRYSVAFNCFVRGRLGDLRDVSMLDLG